MDKMVLKVRKRSVETFQVSSLTSSRNSLVGTSSSECRQLPEKVWPKIAANSFYKHFLGNTAENFYREFLHCRKCCPAEF